MTLAATILLPFALLQGAPAPAPPPSRLAQCAAQVEANAERGYEEAMAWANETRELEAYRCAAMAMVALGRNEEAGRRFESLAIEAGEPALKADLYSQAGNAYLLARLADRAIAAFSQAATLLGPTPETLPDLLIDRSLAYAAKDDWRHAEEDLSHALDLRADDPLALRLRATARMQQRAFDLAEADANAAVRVAPLDVEARVVLGNVREAKRTGEIPLD